MTIAPDTKDWTWVLDRACPECGFDSRSLDRDEIGPRLLHACTDITAALDRPDSRARPAPGIWSPLEYACHVRDECTVFAERLRRILTEDEPAFANWDQDATALEDDYASQALDVVAQQVRAESRALAQAWDAVPVDAWARQGSRSDGAVFTVLSLGRYLVHDVVHHAHDVTP